MNVSKLNKTGCKTPFLGERQCTALKLLAAAQKRNDTLTRAELGRLMGISRVSAHLLVDKLEAAGMVLRAYVGWRNVHVTEAGMAQVGFK
jgi:Mn-dependent DtxR family transcriptional regulator